MNTISYYVNHASHESLRDIDPHKGVSLFFRTNMNKMNSLHHAREHPQISNFLQFESQSSKSFKVRAISELKDLYGNKIRGLTSLDYWHDPHYPACIVFAKWLIGWNIPGDREKILVSSLTVKP